MSLELDVYLKKSLKILSQLFNSHDISVKYQLALVNIDKKNGFVIEHMKV